MLCFLKHETTKWPKYARWEKVAIKRLQKCNYGGQQSKTAEDILGWLSKQKHLTNMVMMARIREKLSLIYQVDIADSNRKGQYTPLVS